MSSRKFKIDQSRIEEVGGTITSSKGYIRIPPGSNIVVGDIAKSDCGNCDSEKMFHDRKDRWLCPFCEL